VTQHIYLVPGFFGFANLGELRYFSHVGRFLGRCCADAACDVRVHAVATNPTASLPRRAARLLEVIGESEGPIHLIGHSSGGLDVRLLATPGIALPGAPDVEPVARRIRTVVTVSAPHHGTPVASFFTSVLGQRLLQLLSLSTMYVLRFGHLPLSALLKLGGAFARVDRHLGVNSALLDQLFGLLLADFSPARRDAIARLLGDVQHDQALLTQLTPEGMEVFNALAGDRDTVAYASVVTRGRAPGVGSTLAAGLDPTAHASHAIYQALYRLAARTERRYRPRLSAEQTRVLRRGFDTLPTLATNDGVVPTLSQVWGEIIHAARGDHLDVIGHFDDPAHDPPHFDWLATGTGFDRPAFDALWSAVARWVIGAAGSARARSTATGTTGRQTRLFHLATSRGAARLRRLGRTAAAARPRTHPV
jgi:triacylglycerol lipase